MVYISQLKNSNQIFSFVYSNSKSSQRATAPSQSKKEIVLTRLYSMFWESLDGCFCQFIYSFKTNDK